MAPRYWVVMPAAGSGRRMGVDTPKQYLMLLQQTVIEWSLAPFVTDARFIRVIVALASDDTAWNTLIIARNPRVQTVIGGAERADSVYAGLSAIASEARADDWVLVHDAARPCLQRDDIDQLIATLTDNESTGGLLATPLADTLKLADAEQRVASTVPRSGLWRALTPQMFRYGVLVRALQQARAHGQAVTDEAAAVEALGLKPRLIVGRADNLKITMPEDIALAVSILAACQA